MLKARDKNNRVISAEDATRGEGVPPFHCLSSKCPLTVFLRSGYQRGDFRKPTSACFYRQAGKSHAKRCPFDVERRLQKIAKAFGTKYLRRQADGTYLLRIMVARWRRQLDADFLGHNDGRRTQKISETRLSAYINTAMGVLRLAAELVEDLDMATHLRLNTGSQSLTWAEFFYDRKNHYRCFKYVEHTNGEVPVAILGRVHEVTITRSKMDHRELALMTLRAPRPWSSATPRVKESLRLKIWSNNKNEFQAYKTGDPLLAFGYWQAITKKNPDGDPATGVDSYMNHELHLWPILPSQICTAEPRKETHASRPTKTLETSISPAPSEAQLQREDGDYEGDERRRQQEVMVAERQQQEELEPNLPPPPIATPSLFRVLKGSFAYLARRPTAILSLFQRRRPGSTQPRSIRQEMASARKRD